MNIILQNQSKKYLRKVHKKIAEEILKKLYKIRHSPLRYLERLAGHSLWKLRIGEYHAILWIDTKKQEIHVLKIGHRKDVYKRL